MASFTRGSSVTVHSLSKAEYNDLSGVVESAVTDGRHIVRLLLPDGSCKSVRIKPANLRAAPQPDNGVMEPLTLAYMGQACWNCDARAPGASLTACADCARAWFCSPRCRVAMAVLHGPACAAVVAIAPLLQDGGEGLAHLAGKVTEGEGARLKMWQRRAGMVQMFARELHGEMQGPERWMTIHALLLCAKCEVCYLAQGEEMEEGDGMGRVEMVCEVCRACFACAEHRDEARDLHSQDFCSEFRKLTGAQAFQRMFKSQTGEEHCYVEAGAAREPMPAAVAEKGFRGFGSYFDWRAKKENLDEVRTASARRGELAPSGLSYFEECATACLSPPLNIVQGLVKFGLHTRDSLVVHVVGAEAYEFAKPPRIWEEIIHVLAPLGLKRLEIALIGPGLPGFDRPDPIDIPSCPDCEQAQRQMRFFVYSGIYEDFLKRPGGGKMPDMAVSFNSGVHALDHAPQWRGAADILLAKNVPWLLTSYTAEEGGADEKAVREWGAHVTVSSRENPWAGTEPFLDVALPSAFYYNSLYFMCVCGLEKDAETTAAAGQAEEIGALLTVLSSTRKLLIHSTQSTITCHVSVTLPDSNEGALVHVSVLIREQRKRALTAKRISRDARIEASSGTHSLTTGYRVVVD